MGALHLQHLQQDHHGHHHHTTTMTTTTKAIAAIWPSLSCKVVLLCARSSCQQQALSATDAYCH